MKRRGRIYASIVLVVVGFALTALSAVVLNVSHEQGVKLVHPARVVSTESPAKFGLEYSDIQVRTSDGLTLKGWWAPSKNGGAFVLVHGYGGNRAGLLEEAAILGRAGYGSILLDLRNSGESEGSITTFGLYETRDVQAAYQYVLGQPGIDPNRIGILGESMGAATTILAAAQQPGFRLAIAESPYASLEDEVGVGVHRFTGLPPFPFAPFIVHFGEQEAHLNIGQVRPIDAIGQISPRPVFLLHGGRDNVIPADSGDKLFAAAHEPKEYWFVPEAEHTGFYRARPEEFTRRLLDFIGRYMGH